MMKHRGFITLPILVLSLFSIGNPPPCHARGPQPQSSSDLHSRLNALTGVMVRKIEALPGFKEGFEIAVVQPVDHHHPGGAKFTQRAFLSEEKA